MSSLPFQVGPQYGLHPDTGNEYLPSSATGFPSYDSQVKKWTGAAYEEAVYEHGQNEEIQKVSQQIDYIMGKQWTKKRPTYRASPVDNRVWGLVWELVSTLTDIRPVFEVRESDPDDQKKKNMARKLTQVTRSWWLSNNVDLALAMGIVYGLLCMGYFKLSWNEELKMGRGDFEVLPLGPHDVLPLKARTDIQQSECIIYRSVQSLGWFRRKFKLRGELVKPDTNYSNFSMGGNNRPSYFTQTLWDSISPQMRRVMGIEQQARSSVYPMALYREFWFKDYSYNTSNKPVLMGRPRSNWSYMVDPGEPLYPRGRLIVMGGDEWMADIPNPYLHGKHPFGALRLNAVPWQFTGLSEIRPMMPMQDVINNVLAGILDMIKKAVNPIFYAPENAFSDSVWDSIDWGMPGAKAQYSPISPSPPAFGPTPNLPSFVFQMLSWASKEMDRGSGIAAVSEALHKKQVPGGDTLENMRQTQQTPLRLKGRNIEVMLRDLGSMQIHNFFQFYTDRRQLYLPGAKEGIFREVDWNPQKDQEGMDQSRLAHQFEFLLEGGTLLNLNRMERIATLARLRVMRDIDRRTLIENLDLGLNVDEIEKRLKAEPPPPMPPGKGAGRQAMAGLPKI